MMELRTERHIPKYIGQDMAEYLSKAKFEDLPAEVVKRAKHIVMDAMACMLAGYETRKLYDISLEGFSPVPGTVRPVGMELETGAAMAAFLNAVHAQTHDANDGLNNSGMLGGAYHPGRTVVSVALAVGQQVHASGKDVLLAIVLGIEAAARMRNPAHKNFVADCYSGAAVAAKLMGADEKQMHAALSFAALLGPAVMTKKAPYMGPCHGNKNSGHSYNVLPYGMISRTAVEAAELAMMGYPGAELDDNQAISSRYYTCGLGKEYMCMDMYFKPWPCCRKTHGAISAALALRNEHGVKAEDIKSIRIYQQTTGMYVNTPFDENTDICYGGQFSLQYTVTCAFLDGAVELRHYRWPDRKAPQKYVDFAKKIKVIADNGLDGHNAISPNHGIVEVELLDGSVLSMYSQYPLGSEPNGMTDAQREEKFRAFAGNLPDARKDELVDWIMNLDQKNF